MSIRNLMLPEKVEGKKFGHWKVIKLLPKIKYKRRTCVCQCDCGYIKTIQTTHLGQYAKADAECRKCARAKQDIPIKFIEYEDINKTYWRNFTTNAKKRKLDFNITPKYVWEVYIKQNKSCKYTGVYIAFGLYNADLAANTASIDRIDNTKGYIEGNIQLVHKSINILRGRTDSSVFIYLCRIIAEHTKNISIPNYDKSCMTLKRLGCEIPIISE